MAHNMLHQKDNMVQHNVRNGKMEKHGKKIFLIIDNHVKNRKCGNFVSISSLTDECAAQKL